MKYESDALYHHGIRGMQWGVRRFQNEDGTLTEEGRRRYLDQTAESVNVQGKAIDKVNEDLRNINKKYDKVDLNDDKNNLEYTKEIRDSYQKHYREALAKDIGADPSTLEGQKWLKELYAYDYFDQAVSELEKKVGGSKEKTKSSIENVKKTESKKEDSGSKEKYAGKKMTQEQAINQAYDDLEKKYKDFNKLPLDKQDELFFDYLNTSGLYKYM